MLSSYASLKYDSISFCVRIGMTYMCAYLHVYRLMCVHVCVHVGGQKVDAGYLFQLISTLP